MIVSPVPLWEIDTIANPNPDMIVRLRLTGEDFFGEYTLEELRSLYFFTDYHSMARQFRHYFEFGAFTWIPEQRVHEELMPIDEYKDKVPREPKVDLATWEAEARTWPRFKIWGARRTPVEDWETTPGA